MSSMSWLTGTGRSRIPPGLTGRRLARGNATIPARSAAPSTSAGIHHGTPPSNPLTPEPLPASVPSPAPSSPLFPPAGSLDAVALGLAAGGGPVDDTV